MSLESVTTVSLKGNGCLQSPVRTTMIALDNWLFYLVNRNCSNRFFDTMMPLVTLLGDWKVLLAAAVILLFFPKKGIRKFALVFLAGLAVSYGIVFILKTLIARPRPPLALPDVIQLSAARGGSFPSGHAANIFLLITLLVVYSKKLSYLYLLALLVIFSRVYLGVHYPSDVAAGAIIGTLLGLIVRHLIRGHFPSKL